MQLEAEIDNLILPRSQYDSPWKEVLEDYFKSFMQLCFPKISENIDWSKKYESLDKELNSISQESETGKCIADKLFKVWLLNGKETWVLLHVEIQAQRQITFEERMHIYNYRLFDRYQRSIVSIAILADEKPSWRPTHYERNLFGCKLRFDFLMIKVLDYEKRRKELSESRNPFSVTILAQLDALKNKKNLRKRLVSKLRLTKTLYEKGWEKNEIIRLYRFIDWVIALPEPLELEYHKEMANFEGVEQMRYVTTAERIGIAKGMKEGMLQGMLQGRQEGKQEGLSQGIIQGEATLLFRLLQRKFGGKALAYRDLIEQADSDQLLCWTDAILTANSLEEIFKNKKI